MNGLKLIDVIVEILKSKNILLYDSNILAELRKLTELDIKNIMSGNYKYLIK